MEQKRRCGWLEEPTAAVGQPVWARRKAASDSCPTSYITPESIALLEEFHVWKLFGASDVYQLPARLVEAIFMLENELRSESNDAQA